MIVPSDVGDHCCGLYVHPRILAVGHASARSGSLAMGALYSTGFAGAPVGAHHQHADLGQVGKAQQPTLKGARCEGPGKNSYLE